MGRIGACVTVLMACQPRSEGQPEPGPGETPGFTLRSEAFAAGEAIPTKFTCEGEDRSPPLRWSGVPAGTASLALVVADPDAPDPAAPKRTWVHWVLVDLPPVDGELPEAVTSDRLPSGTRTGKNDWERADYGGPCPPIGRHRYFHRLYALDVKLPELSAPTRAELERAISGHVLGQAELIGTYQKTKPAEGD